MPLVTQVQQLLPVADVTATWVQTFGPGGPDHYTFVDQNVDTPSNVNGVGTRSNFRNERHTMAALTPIDVPFATDLKVIAAKWRGIFQADFQGATDINITISWFIDSVQMPIRSFLMTFPTNQLIESNYIIDVPFDDFINIDMRTRNSFGFGFSPTTLIQMTEWQMDVTIQASISEQFIKLETPLPSPREFYAGFPTKRYRSLFLADMHATANLEAPIDDDDILLPSPIKTSVTLEAPIVLTINLESPIDTDFQ